MKSLPLKWSISCCTQVAQRPSKVLAAARSRRGRSSAHHGLGARDLGILLGNRKAAFLVDIRSSELATISGLNITSGRGSRLPL